MNATLDSLLDEVAGYPIYDKEMILEILEKRLNEEKRELLYRKYKKAVKDFQTGKVKTGSADDLFASLNA